MSHSNTPAISRQTSTDDDSLSDPPNPILLDLTPPTLSHLSSIPVHLRPLSPYLAALHDARLRLISSPLSQPGGSRSPIRWCNTCGSIRENYPASPTAGSRAKSPIKIAGSKKCAVCGNGYKRMSPAKYAVDPEFVKTYRAARTVRRSLRGKGSMADIPSTIIPVNVEGDVFSATAVQAEMIPIPTLEDDPMDAEQSQPSLPDNIAPIRPDPPGHATPLASPSLRYIPSTSPTPPTYIQPPPVRVSPTKSGSGTVGKAGKADSDGTKRKKKKASGLAKLLAQSKEREEGQMGGKWGFG